jgi:methylated-DNA-[protein]-cysteine S-methyltransferase
MLPLQGMNHFFKLIKSPVGKLTLVANENKLVAILWENEKLNRVKLPALQSNKNHPVLIEIEKQLGEYFEGTRTEFTIPLEFKGTEFQKKVWKTLQKIPYGKTYSYSQLAEKIGSPKSSRAVGAANGKNPLSIVCPCHRVIGKSGKLVGFAGGLKNKVYLLELENKK